MPQVGPGPSVSLEASLSEATLFCRPAAVLLFITDYGERKRTKGLLLSPSFVNLVLRTDIFDLLITSQ